MGTQLILDTPRMPAAEGLGGNSVTSGDVSMKGAEEHTHLAPTDSLACLCSILWCCSGLSLVPACPSRLPNRALGLSAALCCHHPDAQRYCQPGFPSPHLSGFLYPHIPSQAGCKFAPPLSLSHRASLLYGRHLLVQSPAHVFPEALPNHYGP